MSLTLEVPSYDDCMDWQLETSPVILHCKPEPFNPPRERKYEETTEQDETVGKDLNIYNILPGPNTAARADAPCTISHHPPSVLASRWLMPVQLVSNYILYAVTATRHGVDAAYTRAKRRLCFHQYPAASSSLLRRSPIRPTSDHRSTFRYMADARPSVRMSTRNNRRLSPPLQPRMPCTYPESPQQAPSPAARKWETGEVKSRPEENSKVMKTADNVSYLGSSALKQSNKNYTNPLFRELDDIHAEFGHPSPMIPTPETPETAATLLQRPQLAVKMSDDIRTPNPCTPPKSRKSVAFVASPRTGRPVTRTKRYVVGEAMSYPSPTSSRDEDSTINYASDQQEKMSDMTISPMTAKRYPQTPVTNDAAAMAQIQQEFYRSLADTSPRSETDGQDQKHSPHAPHFTSQQHLDQIDNAPATFASYLSMPKASHTPENESLEFSAVKPTDNDVRQPSQSPRSRTFFDASEARLDCRSPASFIPSRRASSDESTSFSGVSHVPINTLDAASSLPGSSSESINDSFEISLGSEADRVRTSDGDPEVVQEIPILITQGEDDVFVDARQRSTSSKGFELLRKTSSSDLVKEVGRLLISPEKPDPLVSSGRRSSLRQRRKSEELAKLKAQEEEEKRKDAAEQRKKAEEQAIKDGLRRIPKFKIIQPLSAEADAKVEDALKKGMQTQVALSTNGNPITRRDIGKVLPQHGTGDDSSGWLNDEVISAYLQMIVDYGHKTKSIKRGGKPMYHAFNAFFYTNLQQKGYEGVKRWAKKAKMGGKDLLNLDHVFIPVNKSGNHWTMAVVSPKRRKIEYFDSMHGKSKEVFASIRAWLKGELGSTYIASEWKTPEQAGFEGLGAGPDQNNMSDCGVFAITNAKMVLLGVDPMAVDASDMPLQRRRIVAEVLNGGFSGEYEPIVEF